MTSRWQLNFLMFLLSFGIGTKALYGADRELASGDIYLSADNCAALLSRLNQQAFPFPPIPPSSKIRLQIEYSMGQTAQQVLKKHKGLSNAEKKERLEAPSAPTNDLREFLGLAVILEEMSHQRAPQKNDYRAVETIEQLALRFPQFHQNIAVRDSVEWIIRGLDPRQMDEKTVGTLRKLRDVEAMGALRHEIDSFLARCPSDLRPQ